MALKHVALILDGNRRWATARGLPPMEGHRQGAEAIKTLLKWAAEAGREERERYVPSELSMYVFSMQNFQRSPEEVGFLMQLFVKAFTDLAESKDVKAMGLGVYFLGRVKLLPQPVQRAIARVEKLNPAQPKARLNFCIAYGGREEILDAVNAILKEGKSSVTEQEFASHLYNPSEPEIVIRTGDVIRTSNFLPWQTIYSEWFFLKKNWPDFTPADFKAVVDEFYTRERRFGK